MLGGGEGKQPRTPMSTNNADQLPALPATADDVVAELDGSGSGAPFPIVGVGASAGGLKAFTELLKALPADSGIRAPFDNGRRQT
jgi:chemotaxis response regulator CheB